MRKATLFFISFFIFGAVCFAQTNTTESLTITTYYPSPYGVYRNLKLTPTDNVPSAPAVSRGVIYYNNSLDTIRYYNKTGSWVNLSGGQNFWKQSGAAADIVNANSGHVGIGTNNPDWYAKLDVHGGAVHIFNTTSGGLLLGFSDALTPGSSIQGWSTAGVSGDLCINCWAGNVSVGNPINTNMRMDVHGPLNSTNDFCISSGPNAGKCLSQCKTSCAACPGPASGTLLTGMYHETTSLVSNQWVTTTDGSCPGGSTDSAVASSCAFPAGVPIVTQGGGTLGCNYACWVTVVTHQCTRQF